MHTQDISLAEARALIDRAIAKAEDLGVRGAVVVVGASGVLVSASRMDRGGTGGMARATSKAWIAATQQMPSLAHLERMRTLPPPMVSGFVACSPEAVFPGAGGMPIESDGEVIAGIAASGATVGPFLDYPGAERRKLIADGKPANCEDLLVHYALGRPYEGQHGDDEERWRKAYGDLPDEPGLGMADPPPASRQPEHTWARALADRALAEAAARGVRIAVAITDKRGDPIQQDTMDDAPTAAPFLALGAAAAAATFQLPSRDLPSAAGELLPFTLSNQWGAGVPITEDGRVVAGLAVAGAWSEDEEIARAVAG